MKVIKVQKYVKLLTDLKFAILILAMIAFTSSLGSFIEQDEPISFYQENYSNPIYGFIDTNFILQLGLDHVLMSGSGPAVFAITSSFENASELAKILKKREESWRVFVVKTV